MKEGLFWIGVVITICGAVITVFEVAKKVKENAE